MFCSVLSICCICITNISC